MNKDALRTDSGQISRAKENPQQTVLAYRQARYGLTEAQAKDQRAATELGRLCLSGAITQAMYDAGVQYLELHDEMLRAIKAPVGLRKTNASGDGGDMVSEDYVTWAIGAVAKWKVFEMKGWPCMQMVVIDDQPTTEGITNELRVALAILAKRFGIIAFLAQPTT